MDQDLALNRLSLLNFAHSACKTFPLAINNIKKKNGSGGIRTHASEETGA